MQARPGEPEHPARPPQAKPLPAQPMHNPLGPSDCIAASSSPMPRPPPPTRCAVAMVAAPGKAQACAIPIHKEIDHAIRSEEHTSELQSLMRISYAVFCLKKKNTINRKKREIKTIQI